MNAVSSARHRKGLDEGKKLFVEKSGISLLHAELRIAESERSACIVCTDRPDLITRRITGDPTEAIQSTEGQAGVVRAGELDCVVGPIQVVEVIEVALVRRDEPAPLGGSSGLTQIVDGGFGLATERYVRPAVDARYAPQ